MFTRRSTVLLPALLGLALLACGKGGTTNPEDASEDASHADHAASDDELAGREVVDNWEAGLGDVTVCPISGRKFEVDEKSGHLDYQGHTFVFCCSGGCLDKVRADPGKYLDDLVEQAGGPKPVTELPDADPDPADGGAIDDGPDNPG